MVALDGGPTGSKDRAFAVRIFLRPFLKGCSLVLVRWSGERRRDRERPSEALVEPNDVNAVEDEEVEDVLCSAALMVVFEEVLNSLEKYAVSVEVADVKFGVEAPCERAVSSDVYFGVGGVCGVSSVTRWPSTAFATPIAPMLSSDFE